MKERKAWPVPALQEQAKALTFYTGLHVVPLYGLHNRQNDKVDAHCIHSSPSTSSKLNQ